ncbi:carbon-nitrogen hydrolase [Xylariaceae sp. FL0804]|nr:carbon-nitrogen hydrolase [Xylariaceae sp. FL0804]
MATLRVAVTQAEPVWLDMAASIKKACELIAEAADGGARLVAFSEVWLPGYPAWMWSRPADMEFQTKYVLNSPSTDDLGPIKAAAKRHSIAVVLGFSERTPSHSVYISQAIVSPQGELVLKRRKIKPTHVERAIFGDGSGPDLTTTAELDFGAPLGRIRVSCLACWEHAQPLLKYHSASQGAAVHVSMWPPVDDPPPPPSAPGPEQPEQPAGLCSMTAEGCRGLSQTYAVEAAAYVLHSTAVCSRRGVDALRTNSAPVAGRPGGGHSCVVGPDGRLLTRPLRLAAAANDDDDDADADAEVEGIVYADLDLAKCVQAKTYLDTVGHYSRPDLLWLGVDARRKDVVRPQAPDTAGPDTG